MADAWYCEIAGREIGPLSGEQLRAMAAKGQIMPNDCVRQGAQGSWVLARQVKGLLPPARAPEKLPVAERLPEAAAVPSPLPPPPSTPPAGPDVFDPVALGIIADPGTVTAEVHAHKQFGRSREKQRQERQKMLVGVLAAAVVALAVVGLLLTIGGSPQPQRSGSAPAAKAPAAKPALSPDALEAREGIDSLDASKPQSRKLGGESSKTPSRAEADIHLPMAHQ